MKNIKLNNKINLNKILVSCTLIFNLFLLLIFLKMDSYLYQRDLKGYEAGKVAERTIIAEHDFDYIDKKRTSRRNYELERNITPVFKVHKEITDESLLIFDLFLQRFKEYSDKVKNQNEMASKFEDLKSRYKGFDTKIITQLYEKPSLFSLLEISKNVITSAMNKGIIASEKESLGTYNPNELIEIWRWSEGKREKEDIYFSDILVMEKIKEYAISYVKGDFEKDAKLIADIVYTFSRENCFYDFEETQKKRNEVFTSTIPVYKTIKKGTVIIEKGFIITDHEMLIISAMGSNVVNTNLRKNIAILFYLLAIYFLITIFFSQPGVIKKTNTSEVVFLIILSELYFIYALVVFKFLNIPEWLNYAIFIPTSLFTMVISIIITQTAALYFSLIVSIIVLILGNFTPFPALFCVFNGIAGVFFVKKADTRIDLIIAGIKTGFFNIFFIITFLLFSNAEYKVFISSSSIAFLNGFLSGIVVLGILPIIELILNSPTRFRLIELLDLNNPILKKMHSLAPGTFNHSLSVGNLAENACQEIGANALLARVGAYYHDIGKIDQAEYFIENQKAYNKHDYMKPSLSVSVIKSHVKNGIEKGKELRLPQALIDIIAQHHGNGLISYFYVKALKLGNETKINPKDYSYVEGKPKSKEAAVVLLADNVEAAVRTLKKPTVAKIDSFVWEVLLSKIKEDHITESELTFNDLKIIKDSFVTTLTGAFHSRIEYPDIKKAEKEVEEKNIKKGKNNEQ